MIHTWHFHGTSENDPLATRRRGLNQYVHRAREVALERRPDLGKIAISRDLAGQMEDDLRADRPHELLKLAWPRHVARPCLRYSR